MRMLLGYKMMNVVVDDAIVLRVERALYERSINLPKQSCLVGGAAFLLGALIYNAWKTYQFFVWVTNGKNHFWYLFLHYILIICFIRTEKVPVFKTKKFLWLEILWSAKNLIACLLYTSRSQESPIQKAGQRISRRQRQNWIDMWSIKKPVR